MISIHAGTLNVLLDAFDLDSVLRTVMKGLVSHSLYQDSATLAPLQSALQSTEASRVVTESKSAPVPPLPSKQLKLIAKFDTLLLTLRIDSHTPFAFVSLDHAELNFEKTAHKLTTIVRLDSFKVLDQTGFDSIHTDIVSCNRRSGVFFEISFTAYEKEALDYPGFKSALGIRLNGLRVIFLMRFTNDLVTFFTNSKVPAIIDQLTKLPDFIVQSLISDAPIAAVEDPILSSDTLVRMNINLSDMEVIKFTVFNLNLSLIFPANLFLNSFVNYILYLFFNLLIN